MFYSIDGIDGTGKSTQLKLLCEYLTRRGDEVVFCRDPGSTALSEELRQIILHREDLSVSRMAQLFLFMAARAQLVVEVIKPALDSGRTVVCDRFLLANVVYQGYAGGLDPERIWEIGQLATQGYLPDKTFVLDVPPDIAASRMGNRVLDRIEKEDQAYKSRLRDGYIAESQKNPNSVILINSAQSIEGALRDIIQRL